MDYVKGMDLSTMNELEKLGAVYYDHGTQTDLLEIMKHYDIDTIRLRLWNDPYSESGEPYGAGTNDLDTTLAIAKKVTDAGLQVLLNFHYSDFWADPLKQIKPKAWQGMTPDELADAVYSYTRHVMRIFKENQIRLSMVQIGNELTNGLLWPDGKKPDFDHIAQFVNAGIRAVRSVDETVPIMLHLDNGGNAPMYREWFDEYLKRGEPFEIIGLSYYPFWHGTINDLKQNMDALAGRYHKDLIIAETSMGFTMEDYQAYEQLPDSQRKGYATKPKLVESLEFPMTPQGQADFMKELLTCIHDVPEGRGKGFFYWEPAWIPVKGSGWATPASLRYMNDPGPCGNEWANQALFDYDGNALPAWDVIRDDSRDSR